jgi:hypothetical protein
MQLPRIIGMAAGLAALIALQSTCFAAPPTENEIAKCRAETDASTRLGCYDQLFGESATAGGAISTMQPPVSHRFGFHGQAGGQSAPKSLAFVVARVDRRPAGEFVVTFEDGQVWQQTELNTKIDIQRGDQVVIRKASLGSFLLVSRAGLSTRVKRLH